jgi:hypothetical protein
MGLGDWGKTFSCFAAARPGTQGLINGLFIVFTGFFSSSPKAFIGDPVFLKKSLDSRSKALRE